MADPDHVLSSDVDTNCSTGRAVWYTRFRDRPTSACNCGHTVFLPGRTSQSCYRRRPGRTQYNNDHWRSRKIPHFCRSLSYYMLTAVTRSPPLATHVSSVGQIMHVTAAYSSSSRIWPGASLVVHSTHTTRHVPSSLLLG
jgi:hypothetical protein